MRILFAFVFIAVVAVAPAFADAGIGCGDDTTLAPARDMSIQDLASPRDQARPSDLSRRDARRDRRRRRRAAGMGLVLLSGLGAAGFALARRGVRA